MTEGNSQPPPTDFASRLRALRERVGKERGGEGGGRDTPRSAAGWAWRLSVELAAGLLVGGVIGWLLDQWLGTKPGFLIAFFVLGAAAGIVNVVRAARALNRDGDGTQA
jgi:ATP synthase protein I